MIFEKKHKLDPTPLRGVARPYLDTIRNVMSKYDWKSDESSDGGNFAWRVKVSKRMLISRWVSIQNVKWRTSFDSCLALRVRHESKLVLHERSLIVTNVDTITRLGTLPSLAKIASLTARIRVFGHFHKWRFVCTQLRHSIPNVAQGGQGHLLLRNWLWIDTKLWLTFI